MNSRLQQVARISAARRDDDGHSSIPEKIRAVHSVALAGKWEARGERSVAESAAVIFHQHERLQTLHSRTAVSEQQVDVAVVVHVAEVPAHGAPAAVQAHFARLWSKRAVAIIVIDHKRRAILRPV